MTSLPYATPAAFRRALTDRLRAIAAPNGLWSLTDLQRQFAYDRLLARLYRLDDGWIVKGATALLARHGAAQRPSTRFKDLVDLVSLTAMDEALAAVCSHLDPLLDGTAEWTWHPPSRRWAA